MRLTLCVLTVAVGLVLPAADLGLAPAPVRAEESAASGVRNEEYRFDVFLDTSRKCGSMRLKIMAVRDVVILDTELTAPFKGKRAGFDSQVVYRGTEKPALERGKVTTRLGDFKLMDGTIEVATGATPMVKASALGYADKEMRPFDTERTWEKDIALPEGLVLTHAALLYFAPRLLPKPGKIEKVAHAEFPDDIGWPELINFKPDCVLARDPEGPDGTTEFRLQRVLAGGNIVPILKMTIDREGKILETTLGQFTMRPEGGAGPAKPKAAK